MRNLYTPKEKISEIVFYKDGKILEKKDMGGMKEKDEWNLWGERIEEDDEIVKKYRDYTDTHN